MAAPSTTKWGSSVMNNSTDHDEGKIGINVSLSSTSTVTTVTITVYFWSEWSVSDSNNTFYFNNEATSATTSKGSVTIKHTDNTTGWGTSNQTVLGTYTYTYNRGTSAVTKNCAAKFTGIDVIGSSNAMTVSTSYTIPALVTYNLDLNGYLDGVSSGNINGYGTADVYINGTLVSNDVTDYYAAYPSGTKYEIKDIKATTGHTYNGVYKGSISGTIGTDNVGVYLNFTTNTYTISYNANGHGTAPSSQTKTYGTNLTLRSFIANATATGYKVTFNANGGSSTPTAQTSTLTYKQTYWNTNASGTGTNYSSGGTYTANAAATLYAIWSKTNGAVTLASAISRANAAATGYTVTFNANGGSCSTSSLTAARTTSYTFGGWNTNSSGTGTNYSAGASYTPTAAVTLYAKWNSSTSTSAITLPTATRTGYTFKGWATSSTATSASYSGGASYTPTGAITLYAVWQARPSQNVYIYSDGTVYARGYFTSSSMYIDSTGAIYAPAFTTGTSFYFSSSGVTAKAFKEGTP